MWYNVDMAAESGNQDADRMEREVADFVHDEQKRGAEVSLDDAGYHEVPALAEQDATAEELEARAKASIHALPAPDQSSPQAEDRDWPPDIEKQVELGRITAGQADLVTGKKTPPPLAEDEAA
jgi:hypothetical protein